MREIRKGRRDFLRMALGTVATAAIPPGLPAGSRRRRRGTGGTASPTDTLEELFAGLRLYWGDLHGHTAYSDGFGPPTHFYEYAGLQKLDFGAVSDHSEWINYYEGKLPMADGSPVPLWANLVREAEARYVPGAFVPFPAFEWTNDEYGHRTVVYARPDRVPSTNPSAYSHTTPPELWKTLEPYPAMTIPHHVTRWGSLMDWSYYNPRLDRLVEIYSKWGNGANVWTTYEPMTKYRQYPFLRSEAAGSSVDAMLALGYRIGIVAASDSHQGQPGSTTPDPRLGTVRPDDPTTGEEFLKSVEQGYRYDLREPAGGGGGLAGVWAPELTREAIWDGLYARRTMGTTGVRPIVKFAVRDGAAPGAGATMGGELIVSGRPILYASVLPEFGSSVTQIILLNTEERLFTAVNPQPGVAVSFQDNALAVGETACYRALILIRQKWTANVDGDTLLYYNNGQFLQSADPQLYEQVWTSPIWVTRAAAP